MGHPYFDLSRPIVFGHRGASGELPENTLPSFARALAQGAQVIETDVHRTRDGVVVICHDAELERTTDGEGPIGAHDFAALRALDAGYRFSPDGGRSCPLRGQGIQIPSLREAFEAFPGIRFNVEVKSDDPELVDAVLAEIARAGREKLTLVAAGEDSTMRALRAGLAARGLGCAVGASPADVVGFVQALDAGGTPPEGPMALQIPPSFAGRELATPELCAFARRHGVQIHVWTVNEPDEMRRLLEVGVDGVMSDFPGRLAEVVAAFRERSA